VTTVSAYEQLQAHFRKIANFEHAAGILHWDHAVMMPPGSAVPRAEALAALALHLHELGTDPRIPEWVESAASDTLDEWQVANLREIRHDYLMNTAVPGDLVEALSRATSTAEAAWRDLRAENNWQDFQPHLEKVFELTREKAQALGEALETDPYDALVAIYQSGISCSEIDPLFDELSDFLPPVIESALQRQRDAGEMDHPATGISTERQRALALTVTESLGYDFNRGRIDTAHHPFCGGATGDVRITTRYSQDDFLHSLLAIIHETGHALYEQNRPTKHISQPVGHARGMAMHESQSLFMEKQVAKSAAFIGHLAPLMRQHLDPQADYLDERWSAHYLYRLVSRVKPGLIRVDADECTYPLHIILRYEMEKRLVAGTMEVADIPDAWTADMERLLGLSTQGDYRNGCMQDVHWPSGGIGYFPTYTLGAVIAAQFKAAMTRELGDLDEQLERGDLSRIKAWLADKVWSQGCRLELQDLLLEATGKTLSSEDFRDHIVSRYGS
jgi:carboxypeptidase Taq